MDPEIENLHSRLHRQHGRDVVQGLRELEKTTNKIASWTNHRHFNVRCVHNNVTPNSIRLKTSVKGDAAQKILRKTERKLTNIRISQCNFTVNKLEDQKKELEDKLFTKLSTEEKQEAKAFIAHAQSRTFELTKTKQRERFQRLLEKKGLPCTANAKKYANITKRWVVNISDVKLEPEAESLLRKGLNYAITPKSLPVDEYITATEIACKQIKPETADILRNDVVKAIKRFKNPKPNLTIKERKSLQEIKNNKDIMVIGADKGRATVVMNSKDYRAKIMNLLEDS